jgi:hypothetical protein
MKYFIMLRLAEELQPLLTMVTVMLESQWSNYHSLLQHHYHVYSVWITDNTKTYVLYNTYYTKDCLCGAVPIGLYLVINTTLLKKTIFSMFITFFSSLSTNTTCITTATTMAAARKHCPLVPPDLRNLWLDRCT